MAQHPSPQAGPCARPGAQAAPARPAAARLHESLEALILSLLGQILAELLGKPAGTTRTPSLAPLAGLLATWAALSPRRRQARRAADLRAQQDQEKAARAAELRAIRRLVARGGWLMRGSRNRGMSPTPAPCVPPLPIRPARAPPGRAPPGHTRNPGPPSKTAPKGAASPRPDCYDFEIITSPPGRPSPASCAPPAPPPAAASAPTSPGRSGSAGWSRTPSNPRAPAAWRAADRSPSSAPG